ncbi:MULTISPECIES: MaoC/PaaZ C-terminal domain-containing protein [unclassified Halomonas]|uniref:MaoC/PaaZ C-terminal domain-containing protein n=1 Tax=unclassified Halomonas TaxID=2609666 RepID=UPI0006846760|nr:MULTISPECIES: MaoC/PaaZ C-terminal domain-containing protein [unclassified Halomonas]PKH59446.1 dehydratase [Halomonas sp. Choline-3u-9]QGQ70606.1 dehydratase [Halomonas sp. PA16-9]
MESEKRLNTAWLREMHKGELETYATLSGDLNSIHLDHAQAVKAGHPGIICHGMLSMTDIGNWLIYEMKGWRLVAYSCRFVAPMNVGTQLKVSGVFTEQITIKGIQVAIKIVAEDSEGEVKVTGRAVFQKLSTK